MPIISSLMHLIKLFFCGVWKIIEFIAAFIYYIFTEIFVDPFIIIKPIKIAAHWIYDNCDRAPVISLYFTYMAHPENKPRMFHWLSQRPWALAGPPALIVLATVGIKFLALKIAASNPAFGAFIFVGDKITLVPVALRMWDEVRPVVRQDYALRQIDNVINFIFRQLPRRARYVVKRQTRQLKRYFRPLLAPIAARIRSLVAPVRALLHPLRERLKRLLQGWSRVARRVLAAMFRRRNSQAGAESAAETRTPGPAEAGKRKAGRRRGRKNSRRGGGAKRK